MTPEERTRRNAEGAERGCYACPVCGDSHWWKTFHNTAFNVGEIGGPGSARWLGVESIAALCDDCFGKLTPEERLPHYTARLDGWEKAVPSPRRVRGEVDPEDAARQRDDLARLRAARDAITAAVLGGG
jgi:hypothetical protein